MKQGKRKTRQAACQSRRVKNQIFHCEITIKATTTTTTKLQAGNSDGWMMYKLSLEKDQTCENEST